MFRFIIGFIIILTVIMFAIIPVEFSAFLGELGILILRMIFWILVIAGACYAIYFIGWGFIALMKFIFRID